ncbi:MAG: hypothetical protein IJ192_08525 [Clostridia bacterium]|nr:hypothetical protein [Clostridia bacterium]
MKRESKHLFKAKSALTHEWVKGYPVPDSHCTRFYVWDDVHKRMEIVTVDSKTLCQYIGIIDDSDAEIFTNDICKIQTFCDEWFGMIQEEKYQFVIKCHEKRIVIDELFSSKNVINIRVMGNHLD